MWNGTAPSLKARPATTNTSAERQQQRCCPAAASIARATVVEVERAGGAVDHRHAVEQEAGRQRAEHEVLHRRLGRARVIAAAARPARTATATSARGRGRASGSCSPEIITSMPSSANSVSTNTSPRNRSRADEVAARVDQHQRHRRRSTRCAGSRPACRRRPCRGNRVIDVAGAASSASRRSRRSSASCVSQ